MVLKFRSNARNARHVMTYSTLQQHVLMADAILRVPASVQGDVVECGCFCGGSTMNLSLACAAAGRKLWVCDSFAGLPEPRAEEKDEVPSTTQKYWTYDAGDLSSDGGGGRGRQSSCAALWQS